MRKSKVTKWIIILLFYITVKRTLRNKCLLYIDICLLENNKKIRNFLIFSIEMIECIVFEKIHIDGGRKAMV